MIRRLPSTAQVAIMYGLVAAMLMAGACMQVTSRDDDSLEALTIAVKNNPDLELVATDAEAKILTVRVKSADRVITVTPDDLEDGRLVIDAAGSGDSPAAAEADDDSASDAAAAGVTASRDDKQAAVKGSAGGVSIDAGGDGKGAGIKTADGGVSIDAGSDGKGADIKTSDGGVSVDAGGDGKRADIKPSAGGVSIDAGGDGKRADIKPSAGGVSIDAGGKKVGIDGAGRVSVTGQEPTSPEPSQPEPAAPPDAPEQETSPPSSAGAGSGERLVIEENERQDTIECAGHEVVVLGNENELTLVGDCARLELVGNDNSVEAEAVGVIYAPGRDNEVSWERGVDAPEPKVVNPGSGNVIKRVGG